MLTDSKFHMWRTLFALAHADLIITQEERIFMQGALKSLDLSVEQRTTLESDASRKQDAVEMFNGITEEDDFREFFHIAYDLVWIDGDHNVDEERTLTKIKHLHEERAKEQDNTEEIELDFAETEPHKDEGLQNLLDNLKKSRLGS